MTRPSVIITAAIMGALRRKNENPAVSVGTLIPACAEDLEQIVAELKDIVQQGSVAQPLSESLPRLNQAISKLEECQLQLLNAGGLRSPSSNHANRWDLNFL